LWSGETHGPCVSNGDEHIAVIARATRPDGLRLECCPFRLVQTLDARSENSTIAAKSDSSYARTSAAAMARNLKCEDPMTL
jgi:hypothetical protein